ncbi:MAG TPA: flagellar FliJ family protein [Alphaproteobacteria bacterium]|nr:flagellar FliJ family protein [Alphaproteobacteria bacterium]
MADLGALIRLSKWQLDEKRKALTALRNLHDQMVAEQERMELELAQEQRLAAADFEASLAYPGYARAVSQRRERLEISIRQVIQQIEAAADEMANAFQELKKFELAQEERQRRNRQRIAKREGEAMDEAGLAGFIRRQGEDRGGA